MNEQEHKKQMQIVLDAAVSSMNEMERWRDIATMMSHYMTCKMRSKECKFCAQAANAYMEAKEQYAKLDAEYLEIAMGLMK
jgi:hypothetical protein